MPECTPEDDICNETKATKVIKLYKGQGPKKKLTSALLLIFDKPCNEYTYIGFTRYKIHQYRPAPTRCYRCRRFGHIASNCSHKEVCAACGGNHTFDQCSAGNRRHCVNCGGSHSAGYRGCKKYKEVNENLKVSTNQKISYSEAAKLNKQKLAERVNIQYQQTETFPKTFYTSQNTWNTTQWAHNLKSTLKQR